MSLNRFMPANPSTIGLSWCLLFGCATCTVFAQQAVPPHSGHHTPVQQSAVKQLDGFKQIFNGKDFSGWSGAVDGYEVVDGVLRCKSGSGGTLYTKKSYSDFIVRFEFKLPPGGNNGLAIRYPGQGDTAYVGMCELQVLDNSAEKFAGLDDRQYHGSVYGVVAAQRGALRKPGQWNTQQVTVVAHQIKVELNGQVILDADLSGLDPGGADFLDGRKHPGLLRTEGHFGFAGHLDPVEFRNVFIKELK